MSDLDDIASLLGSDLSTVRQRSGSTSTRPGAGGAGGGSAPIDLSSLAAEMSNDLANVKGTPDIEVVSAEQVRTLVGLLQSKQGSTVEEAAKAMSNLTLQDQNIPTILSNGAVPPLANHLANPDANIQLQASWALSNLMVSENGRTAAMAQNVCPQLVALLSHPLAPLQDRACVAIANLALDEAPRMQLFRLGAVGPLANMLRSPDVKMQENAAWALGNLLANEDVQAAVGANQEACRSLINMLNSSAVDVIERSIRALANIALLETNSDQLRNLGAIPQVVRLLNHANSDVKFHACRAINNLAIATANENALVQAGAIEILVSFLDGKNEALVDQAIQSLANLCMGMEACQRVYAARGVGKVCKLLQGNIRCKLNASRTVANLAREPQAAEEVRSCGGIPGLVGLLTSEEILKASALQALLNLASASDAIKGAIAQADAGPKVAALISSNDNTISKSAANVALNISVDPNPLSHQKWREGGVYKACINACNTCFDPSTKAQVLSCLANAAAHESNEALLAEQGVVTVVVKLLADRELAVQQQAARCILNCSAAQENYAPMRSQMPSLVAGIQSINDNAAKGQLINSCVNWARDEDCRKSFKTAGGIPVLVNHLSSADALVAEYSAIALFNLSFTKENKEEMIKLGTAAKAGSLQSHSSADVRAAGEKLKKLLS